MKSITNFVHKIVKLDDAQHRQKELECHLQAVNVKNGI